MYRVYIYICFIIGTRHSWSLQTFEVEKMASLLDIFFFFIFKFTARDWRNLFYPIWNIYKMEIMNYFF